MLAVLTRLAQATSEFDYDYDFSTSSTSTDAASAGVAVAVIIFALVLAVVAYLFFSFCYMKIFQKAGKENAWAGFVPIYNEWVRNEVAGRPGWWVLAGFIPFVGWAIALVLNIIVSVDLAKSFGKGGGFAALLVLLPFIGYPILAFGDAQYQGPAGPEGGAQNPEAPVAPTPPTSPTVQ